MLVREIGEFGLINRISAMLPEQSAGVIKGIGDDVAVLDTSGPEYLLATCDIQVEGVHFMRDAITPYQLGRRVAAINLSDIAAMGGDPRWALVSLAIPGDVEVGYVEELYRGMREQMALAGASIAGGNLSRMKSIIVLDFTLLGLVAPDRIILRSTAGVGDAILMTGSPGESRAGLELIRRPDLAVSSSARQRLIERHLCPQPRLAEGRLLARSGLVTSMIDVSDGVIGDLLHICESSGKGAEIEAAGLWISPDLGEAALAAGADSLEWALSGGEDYELMFTAAPEAVPDLQKMLIDQTGTSCAQIGRITAGTEVSLRFADGTRVVPAAKGWDHFGG
ncbi:MAG: thiamine-phosphate kinase [Deltaproteobacteria bacterium]|nr:thiamine-phosphate kinase [Deltaproteobacteria bacterium]